MSAPRSLSILSQEFHRVSKRLSSFVIARLVGFLHALHDMITGAGPVGAGPPLLQIVPVRDVVVGRPGPDEVVFGGRDATPHQGPHLPDEPRHGLPVRGIPQ